ncbi:MAG TPA: biotin--[acetyl-CoA-carboxylase] ligase [Azoarcus taiwanensis]|nr:biotin--[acetyl-CoA-carboxylase] ligase [Azoarcus taiwanensis]
MALIEPTILAADADGTARALGACVERFAIVVVEECDSTNSALRDFPPEDDGRTHVLVAHHQRAGRGRRGRTWQAWPGLSLTFSSLWRFAPSPTVPAGLSLVAGLAVACTLEKLGVEGVQLKWPNDVMVFGKKIAGILVELVPGRGRTPAAVIGIGVNLALPSGTHIPDQPGVTSLADEIATSKIEASTVLAGILISLDDLLERYTQGGFAALRDEWQQRNAFADLPVSVRDEQCETVGICAGVDEDGALLLDTDQGRTRIIAGDVSLRAAL